jgi:predicted metal-dependent hydrolase
VSQKRDKLALAVEAFRGQELNPFYLAFFDCFNQQRYYEAHDVLEHLWLEQRQAPNGRFYQGLIQLAGAFVHLQKNRLRPAGALFKAAGAKLQGYPVIHERLNVAEVRTLAEQWLHELESADYNSNPFSQPNAPTLILLV